MNVPRKYGLLRVIAFLLRLLAWLALVAGIIGAIAGFILLRGYLPHDVNLPNWLPVIGLVAPLVAGIVWFVQLYAFGSVLALLIDIEENTRALAARSAAPPA